MAPRRILLVHGKAEASFAHSKRFAQYDGAVHVGASRCEGATEPRGSVWSAGSLLPLWLVPRQHALWNRQDWKAGSCFCFRFNGNGPGGFPIGPLKIEMLTTSSFELNLNFSAMIFFFCRRRREETLTGLRFGPVHQLAVSGRDPATPFPHPHPLAPTLPPHAVPARP